jgi:hypothetical protein
VPFFFFGKKRKTESIFRKDIKRPKDFLFFNLTRVTPHVNESEIKEKNQLGTERLFYVPWCKHQGHHQKKDKNGEHTGKRKAR